MGPGPSKTCPRCRQSLPLEGFAKSQGRKDGRQAWCRTCMSQYRRSRFAADPTYRQRVAQYARDWRADPAVREREERRLRARWANLTPEQKRRKSVERHGITMEQFEAMLDRCDSRCVGCDEPFAGRVPDIDHDHSCCAGNWSCGKCIRGLLCRTCNIADALAGAAWIS